MIKPPKVHLSEEVRRLYPFTSHYAIINGQAYHYLDEGDGRPIILLHGNPTWSFFYREIVGALSLNYRMIAPDHIGCGLSAKPRQGDYGYRLKDRVDDLTQFIKKLNLNQKITLVVHDWGGMIGAAWAVDHVDMIDKMIILNTAAFLPPDGKPIPWRLQMIRNLNHFSTAAVLGLNLFAVGAVIMAPTRPLSKFVRAGYLAPYGRPKYRIATLAFVKDIPLVPTDTSYALAARVDADLTRLHHIPKLILWGDKDFVFDHDYFKEWMKRFPNAEARLFRGAGHYLVEDRPVQLIAQMQSFLQMPSDQ